MTINVSGQFAVYLKSKGIDLNNLKNISAKEFEVLTNLFVKYCDGNANVDSVDFSGVQLPEGVSEAESRTFFQVLKEFFSLETIKLKADTVDKDGYLSEEEVRVFLEQYVNDVDNNSNDISLDDLEGALTNFGITLPTTSSADPVPPSGGTDGTGGSGGTGDGGDGGNGDTDVDDLPLPESVDYAALAAESAANYADTPLVALYNMRDDLIGDVADAREDLQSVQNGTNPAVVQLVADRESAQEALYTAMANDSEAVQAILVELKANDDAVDENDKQSIETLAALTDKTITLGEVEVKLAATEAAIGTTTSELSSVESELGKPRPAEVKDPETGNITNGAELAAFDNAKRALEARKNSLNSELTRLGEEKTALEAQKATLTEEIATLEEKIGTLTEEGKTLETARGEIMTRLDEVEKSPETEAAKKIWEDACKAYSVGTAQLYQEYAEQLQTATMKLNAIEYAIIQKENEVKSNGEELPAGQNTSGDSSDSTGDAGAAEDTRALEEAADALETAQETYNAATSRKTSLLASGTGMNGALRAELLAADYDISAANGALQRALANFEALQPSG